MTNLSHLLSWARKNNNEHNCRVIAAALIAGSEVCAADLSW